MAEERWAVVRPGSEIVASNVDEFRSRVAQALEDRPAVLVLDMADVENLDSSGLAVLLSAHIRVSEHGGCVRVVNVSDDIRDLLASMRLDRHFSVSGRDGSPE
jgi:anti-anti-sigma factor